MDSTENPLLASGPIGLALLCSPDAVVKQIMFDTLGVQPPLSQGAALSSIFDQKSAKASEEFLKAVLREQAATNWPLIVDFGGRKAPLWFSAAVKAGNLEIIGASSARAAAQIREWLAREAEANSRAAGFSERRSAVTYGFIAGSAIDLSTSIAGSELPAQNIEAEGANQEKIRWMLTAAHDLQNQLNAVQACAEVLLEEDSAAAGPTEVVRLIGSTLERTFHFLNNFEWLARAGSADFPARRERIEIAPLIDTAISVLSRAAARKKIVVRARNTARTAVLNGDHEAILQLFRNLLENSIHHCPPESRVEILVALSDNGLHLSFRDNGPGIAAADLALIFTPFNRTGRRVASGEPGTGLGLAICRSIVEKHGGCIWVESNPGEGAAFHITFPPESVLGGHLEKLRIDLGRESSAELKKQHGAVVGAHLPGAD